MSSSEIGTVFLEDLEIGMSRSITKVFDDATVRSFSEVSEDRNPIHLDEAAGAASIFKQRVVHGMLVGSLFSALLGQRLPGQGTIYLGQSLKFLAPVLLGAEVTATVTVAEIKETRRRVTLECEAWVGETQVISGSATVLAPTRG